MQSRSDRKQESSVAVIVPAYNAADYIAEAIRSVQQQTLTDFELIVVDDASTDATPDIVQTIAASDPRVHYTRMSVNVGPSACRNRGFDLTTSEWVALLDSDDRFHPDRLKILVAQGQCAGADVVSDNVMLMAQEAAMGERMIPEAVLSRPRDLPFAEFLHGCHYDATTPSRVRYVFMHPIFRRAFLTAHRIRYDERSRAGEDFMLYVDCFLAKSKWLLIPEPMYLYTIREGSLTDTASERDHHLAVQKMRFALGGLRRSDDKWTYDAVQRHWKLIASDYYYFQFKNALKRADIRKAWAALFRDEGAWRLIAGRIASALRRHGLGH